MPFFRRKKQDEFVGLEEEECNLRDMFGDLPPPPEASAAPGGGTSSSDYDSSPTSSSHSSGQGIETAEPELNDAAQQVMNDNLELMREVVLRIREDEEYARNIYANCPRLQALLNDHPDLRRLFEDPKFIVLNFEKVFRDAGGILPGDEDANKPGKIQHTIQQIKAIMGKITSHPFFKFFKFLLLIKKIVFLFSPTKLGGLVTGTFWPPLDDVELDADGLNPEDPNYEAEKTKIALNNAADALEDPEVQEQMQEAMDDPDKMEEMIENNKELRELRDSNPVCAEMMNDPETFKIISDPENLRALSEAPDLISEDFANPEAFSEALENAEGGDVNAEGGDVDVDAEAEAEADAEVEDDAEHSDEYSEDEDEEEELDDAWLDEVEYEAEDDDERETSRSTKQSRSARQKERDGKRDEEGEGGGGRFGFVSTLMEAGVGIMTGDFEGVTDMFSGGEDITDMFAGGEGITDMFAGGEDIEFEGGEFEGGEDFEGGDEGMPEDIEEVEEEDEDGLLAQAEEKLDGVEETEKEPDENELLSRAQENLEDVEETEKDENEILDQAEEDLEDVEETKKEVDESTQATEDEGVYASMAELDEGVAGQGMDLAEEIDAEEGDKQKDKGTETEEREAQEREARSGGFYGEFEDDGDGGFASGFQSEDPDDDWIRY